MRVLLCSVVLLFVAGCAQPVRAPVGDYSARPRVSPGYHLVRTGDTLYSVAFLYGYSVEEVAEWNDLRAPYTIFKGQKLRVNPPPAQPVAKVKPRPAPPPPAAPPVKPSQPKTQARVIRPSQPKVPGPPAWAHLPPSQPKVSGSAAKPPPSAAKPAPAARPSAPPPQAAAAPAAGPEPAFARHVIWSWPVKGRLLRTFDANATGKKGINIAGKNGDPVRAAAAGKVVYAGSGLGGYGRLIIIKHNKDFLSAYAHNRKLIATEGQWVKKGEVIAQMGSSGTDRTQLHFEIRKKGRPVDPMRYLPKR